MTELTESLSNSRVQQIIDGTLPLSSLNLSVASDLTDFEAAVSASHDQVIGRLTPGDPDAMEFIYAWVQQDPTNVLKLFPEQYFPEILEPYFLQQMKATQPQNESVRSFSIQKTMDGYYSIVMDYRTHDNEEIRYIDAQLRVPTTMTVRLEAHFKLVDILTFLTSLDIDLAALTYQKVELYLNALILDAFRPVMMVVLDKRQIGYYSLTRYYRAITDTVLDRFDANTEVTGLYMSQFKIREVNVPENVVQSMEDNYYAYRQYEQRLEADLRYADLALENYERKAAIHAKYPNFPVAATEAEKDLALNRMLKKMGVYEDPIAKDAHIEQPAVASAPDFRDEYFKQPARRPEKPLAPVAPTLPVKPQKPKHFASRNMGAKLVLSLILIAALTAVAFFVPKFINIDLSYAGLPILPIAVGALSLIYLICFIVKMAKAARYARDYKDENDLYDEEVALYKETKATYEYRLKNAKQEQLAHQLRMAKYDEEMAEYLVKSNLLQKPVPPAAPVVPVKPEKPKRNAGLAAQMQYEEDMIIYEHIKAEYEASIGAYKQKRMEYVKDLAKYTILVSKYGDMLPKEEAPSEEE